MTAQCVVCSRPMADTAYACTSCARGLAETLRTAAGHAEDAEAVIARQTRYGTGGRSRSDEGLTPDWKRSSQFGAITTTISRWADTVTTATGRRPRWKPQIGPLCPPTGQRCHHDSCAGIRRQIVASQLALQTAWLSRQTETIRKHPDAGTAFRELRDACTKLEWLVDRPADNRHLIGICNCGKVLYAPWNWTTIQCKDKTCGATWNLSDGQDILLRHLDGKLVTAGEAVYLAGHLDPERSAEAIRKLVEKWTVRHQLIPHGQVMREPTPAELKADPAIGLVAVPTYRFGDIRDLLAQTPRRNRQGAAA